jgi:hypothetical protein
MVQVFGRGFPSVAGNMIGFVRDDTSKKSTAPTGSIFVTGEHTLKKIKSIRRSFTVMWMSVYRL